MFRWRIGRQNTGYLTLRLARIKFPLFFNPKRIVGFDFYILRYPEGSRIPPHRDPVESSLEHHRINWVIRDCEEGGTFRCALAWRYKERLFYFRPDVCTHSVTRCTKGTRWVISVGWVRKIA